MTLAAATLVACALVATGCKRRLEPKPADRSPAAETSSGAHPAEPPGAAAAGGIAAAGRSDLVDGGAPEGYELASVWEVVSTGDGAAVLVVDADRTTVLPIFVGGTEALTIKLRADGKHYQRPLTHDLLSSLIAELGGHPVRAQIDDLRNDTFYGSVFVRQGERIVELDARPSDAIAMSLGSGAPLFVSRALMLGSGLRREDVEKALRGRELDKPKNVDPIAL